MASFILQNLEEIVSEWESFAGTLEPAATTMDALALRDHARQMLQAIAKDLTTAQSDAQQEAKSQGQAPLFTGTATAAAVHGALRHAVGFDLQQLVAEFRALRATVLRLWIKKVGAIDAETAYEMTRFNEAIDQALAESVATYSQELGKSRDTFLAILGHDLRSPLGAIATCVGVLGQSRDDAVRARALAGATSSVSTMGSMIRDLLEYTRTRLGKGIPIIPIPGSVDRTCRAAVTEAQLAHPGSEFRFEASGQLDAVFDAARLQQAISNLLNNAVQHGSRQLPVYVNARHGGEYIVIEVNNGGQPIPADRLQVIFDPLVQVAREHQVPDGNTHLGLGLFIAREIIVAHGGKISARSEASEGTTITLELPSQPS